MGILDLHMNKYAQIYLEEFQKNGARGDMLKKMLERFVWTPKLMHGSQILSDKYSKTLTGKFSSGGFADHPLKGFLRTLYSPTNIITKRQNALSKQYMGDIAEPASDFLRDARLIAKGKKN